MIKNKIKYFTFILIGVLILPFNVNAGNGTASLGSGRELDIIYNSLNKKYIDYNFTVSLNGSSLQAAAYCLDPGYSLGGAIPVNCEAIGTDEKFGKAMNYLFANLTKNHAVDQLAIRWIGMNYGKNQNTNYSKGHGSNVVAEWQKRMGFVYDPKFGLTGDSEIMDAAFALAKAAWQAAETSSTSTYDNNIVVNKKDEIVNQNKVTIVYEIKSSVNNLSFTYDNCKVINEDIENGTGTITVEVEQPNCSYSINIYGGEEGQIYQCFGEGDGTQNLVAQFSQISDSKGNIVNGSLLKTISGSISSGNSYYETYCAGKDKCFTDIDIPTYCDTPGDQKITITAPTDIKTCILNESDDNENTYQMLDDQIKSSNKYCSVWCKEDYNMDLPGAQYTTSGRYFTLKPTIVNATRTCYTTNPNNKNETNIDIDQFIKDVKSKQEAVKDAANYYLLAQEFYRLSKNPTETKTYDCANKEYIEYSIDSFSITGYNTKCDKDTGVCRLEKNKTINGATTKWGDKANKDNCASCSDNSPVKNGTCSTGTCVCNTTIDHVDNPFDENYLNRAADRVNEAVTALKETIEDFQQCFNWSNQLCFKPEVTFEYDEIYNDQIGALTGEISIANDVKIEFSQSKTMNNEYTSGMIESSSEMLENINYLYCGVKNGNLECDNSTKAKKISTRFTKYYHIKKTSIGTGTYENKTKFESNYPHGTVEAKPPGSGEPQSPYEYLGAVFPVALQTPTGVYKWSLEFKNLGQYNNGSICSDKALGRLDNIRQKQVNADVEYVCLYVVDCPDCKPECVCPPASLLTDGVTCEKRSALECVLTAPECPECKVYCINCVFDGEDTYFYRTVSLNDLNPNDRETGLNWNSNASEKAMATLKEITTKAENAYQTAEYTFTITPSNMKAIRDYNNQTGTYVAEDLTYGSVEGITNIAGKSSFLRKNPQNDSEGYNRNFFAAATLNNDWALWTGNQVGVTNGIVDVELHNASVGPAWK